MLHVRFRRHRSLAGLLIALFAFCLGEATLPEACEGDFGSKSAVIAGDLPEQTPADRTPAHGGPHLCHCAHATSVWRATPPRAVVAVEAHVTKDPWMPSTPSSRTLQPEPRPPIA
jgi:hypothetical protein